MPPFLHSGNVVALAPLTALALALYAAVADARGVGVAHQTWTQTTAVGRAMNSATIEIAGLRRWSRHLRRSKLWSGFDQWPDPPQ